jgi:hypothetical protein
MDKDLQKFQEELMLLIDAFITDTSEVKEVMGRVSSQLEDLEEDMAYINKVVRDGNGRPPVMTRIEVIEEKLSALKETTDKWWQVWMAAVPGLVALITTGAFMM